MRHIYIFFTYNFISTSTYITGLEFLSSAEMVYTLFIMSDVIQLQRIENEFPLSFDHCLFICS